MRCLFNTAAKDVRRFRLYEKSLDALATSPYARTVDRWLLAGWRHLPAPAVMCRVMHWQPL